MISDRSPCAARQTLGTVAAHLVHVLSMLSHALSCGLCSPRCSLHALTRLLLEPSCA